VNGQSWIDELGLSLRESSARDGNQELESRTHTPWTLRFRSIESTTLHRITAMLAVRRATQHASINVVAARLAL
jgi:hypothetical protein